MSIKVGHVVTSAECHFIIHSLVRAQNYENKMESRYHARLCCQAWKNCRSRDLGSDKTADFGITFGENAILVRVSRIKFTFWGINRMG